MLSRRLLLLSVGLGVIAVGLTFREGLLRAGAGLLCGTALLGVGAAGLIREVDAPPRPGERAASFTGLVATFSVLLLLVSGWDAWQEQGSYLAGAMRPALAAALFGIAAVQPTGLRIPRLVLLAAALAGVVLS
jgi:hypothetical protein